MSLTRFISAMVGLALFFLIIFLPPIVLALAIFIISIISINEYCSSMRKAGLKPFDAIIYGSVLLIPLVVFYFEIGFSSKMLAAITVAALFSILILILSYYLVYNRKHVFSDAMSTVFGAVYLVPLFSTILFVRYMDYGIYHIFIAFGGAWITDTFAYFTGRAFGKKKLIPEISPNKTVAGAIGGVIGTTIIVIIYGWYLNNNVYDQSVSYFIFFALGFLLSIFSQFGDLAASAIKRFARIKDFGRLMPGHGGAIDRFDSVLFTAAITFIFILLFFQGGF